MKSTPEAPIPHIFETRNADPELENPPPPNHTSAKQSNQHTKDVPSTPVLPILSLLTVYRVGYVPEHFLTPVLLAHKHNLFTTPISLAPCPSGTGQMLERLKNREIGIVSDTDL